MNSPTLPAVAVAEPLGNQHLHWLADQLPTVVGKQRLRRRVDKHDLPALVDDDDRVYRRLQQPAQNRGLLVRPRQRALALIHSPPHVLDATRGHRF